MGFEIMSFVLSSPEDIKKGDKVKTRAAYLKTAGPDRITHESALILMEALDYELPDCGNGEHVMNIDNTDPLEYEGCGDVLEYTVEELMAAAKRLEEMAMTAEKEHDAKRALKFIDKTIEAVESRGWDKAEIGFY